VFSVDSPSLFNGSLGSRTSNSVQTEFEMELTYITERLIGNTS